MSKISELSQMMQADISTFADMVPILDASTNTVKKIAVNELQGYGRAVSPAADIKSLCTSNYTVSSATARIISGRLAYCEATITNGDTGIPATAPNGDTENLLTLPDSLFSRILTTTFVGTYSSSDPSTAWLSQAVIPLIVKPSAPLKLARPQGSGSYQYIWNNDFTWIASNTKYANGNVRGLKVHFLVLMKNDVMLPYSS